MHGCALLDWWFEKPLDLEIARCTVAVRATEEMPGNPNCHFRAVLSFSAFSILEEGQ
jgi:hypothetical protein